MSRRLVVSNCEIFLFYEKHCSCNPLEIHLNFVYVMLIATNIKIGRFAYWCPMWLFGKEIRDGAWCESLIEHST